MSNFSPSAVIDPCVGVLAGPRPAPAHTPFWTGPTVAKRLANLDWTVVLGIAGMHLACLAAPFTFTWSGLIVFGVGIYLCAGLGICLGYHRLLTHGSFKCPRWVKWSLALLGALSWQGGPVQWVGVHRLHHKDSDQPDDPHSPRHGFVWSHMLWCMVRNPHARNPRDAARDLQRDPVVAWIDRWFVLPQVLLAALLFTAGHYLCDAGLSWLVWGVAVRTVVSYHSTWFVNSAAHTWGYRNFATSDGSRNLWWVAFLSFGEGWHNNHHAQQRSAAHGMRWWELDLTYLTIRLMGLLGLARDIVRPSAPH
jgi:stearoyl-CoA desaturase (delta-9 desaturase)